MDTKSIEIAALGRPLRLGMLYDCRNDTFIPGVTLWDREALMKDLDVSVKPNTEFKILASDSLREKTKAFNVRGSLKASILGGIIELGGSAKYLMDTSPSSRHCRVTLQYSRTTRFEQLTMTQLGQVMYEKVFEQHTATHVVTAVLYGAQAFFVFDQRTSDKKEKKNVAGGLKALIEKIPKIPIGSRGEMGVTEEDKENIQKFACTFHGDFEIQQNPSNYLEAVEVYRMLPSLLGENGEKAVPVRVWLYPLKSLDPRAARLMREISENLVSQIETVLVQCIKASRRSWDMQSDSTVAQFSIIKEKLHQFESIMAQYKTKFQKALSEILPVIRGGEQEEQALVNLLQSHSESPFTNSKQKKWLDEKESEINILRSYTDAMKGIPVMSSPSDLNSILFNPEIDTVICFTFTSLVYKEPYLSVLTHYLWQSKTSDNLKQNSAPVNGLSKEETQPWFASSDMMRVTLQWFIEYAEANRDNKKTQFIIATVSDQSSPGASIRLYRHGKLVTPAFRPVLKPDPPVPIDIHIDRVTLRLLPSQSGETEHFRVEYREVQRSALTGAQWHKDQGGRWMVTDTPDTQYAWTLSGLQPGTLYEFRYRAVDAVGVSEASEAIKIQTKHNPRAAPAHPLVQRDAVSGIVTVSWEEPAAVRGGLPVLQYKVEYKDERWALWAAKLTEGDETTCTIDGLQYSSSYRFRVYSGFVGGETSPPSQEAELSFVGVPRTRDQFLQYACQLTPDLETVHRRLSVSERNIEMTRKKEKMPYPDHPERFEWHPQVLCREGLTGRCYWEVEWSGKGVTIGVACRGIGRKGKGYDSCLGHNDKSWGLECRGSGYSVWHNNNETVIPVSSSPRVGVYLDWVGGTLSFYSVSPDSMLHLHTLEAIFTEPLYPALGAKDNGCSFSLCQLE
nr:PREDICTED: stonustoxin subunit beta-like [Lepisosteus oculatus]